MQWDQIKTLLILSFLILNIYLLVQFTEKQEQADLSVLEHTESTIEDQLEAENIKIPNLSNKKYNETFISVAPKLIVNDELKKLKELKNQDNEVIQNRLIVSKIDEPIKVSERSNQENLNNLLDELVLFPDSYSLWEWNEQANMIVYFQEKIDRPIYYNQSGLVLFYLNEQNEITHYTQTVLGEDEENEDSRDLITSMRAIETLYDSDKLESNDEITSVEMGFHTRVPLDSGVQVFAPTWEVEVNDESRYFVNAIEEVIFASEHEKFFKETLMNIKEKVGLIENKKIDQEKLLEILDKKISLIDGSA